MTTIMAGNGGVSCRYLIEGIISIVGTPGLVGGLCGMVAFSFARVGRLGQSDVQDGWSLRAKDLGEHPRFRALSGAGDVGVSYVLEGIIEVKPQAPSSNLQGKP
jgi:hypothetical protein